MRAASDPEPGIPSWPPAPPIPWLGITGAPEVLAVIWATVDLERTLGDDRAAPTLGAEAPALGTGAAALDDPLLGARIVLVDEADGRRIAVAEPSTEGRLARTLARNAEGPAGWYILAPVDPDEVRSRAAAAGIALSRTENGPFGPSTLVLGGPAAGRHLILVDRVAVPSPP